jgi:hypothetical protein
MAHQSPKCTASAKRCGRHATRVLAGRIIEVFPHREDRLNRGNAAFAGSNPNDIRQVADEDLSVTNLTCLRCTANRF